MTQPRHSRESRNPVTDHLDLWTSALLVKSTAGRGSNGRLEAYGIKKLRGLILDLAVRGKLVKQNPEDESAASLLNLAQAEKKRSIAAGEKNRAVRTLAITDADKPFELPAGWSFARLGDLVLSIKSGGTPSKHNPEFWNGDIPWASVKDLGFGEPLSNTQDRITKAGLEAGSCLAKAGSILICTRMGLGKIGETLVDVAINQDLKAVRFSSALEKEYFVNYYKTISIAGTGMTVAGIKQDELLNFIVALPPLTEQRRIVAKVDELMALCDQLDQQQGRGIEAHQTLVETLLGTLTNVESAQEFAAAWNRIAGHFDTLFTTEHSIDQLKQAILQLAVMGKLVPQDHSDEPAGLLLERIFRQKQAMLKAKQFRQGKVSRPETAIDAPAKLPSGWRWVNVDSLCFKVTDGTHFTPRYVESGVRFVSAKDIVGGVLIFDRCKFISQKEHEQLYRRCNPQYHDIVISKSGSIGTVALIEDRGEFSLFESLALLKFDQKSLFPQYLVYALTHACASLTSGHIRGVGVKHLHLDILRGLELALPPLAEQHRIVTKVDELMALCDALKARLAEAQTTQIHLADAIVERAAQAHTVHF